MKLVIEVEITQSGQPRPYADSLYEAYISMRNEGTLTDGSPFYYDLNEDAVKNLARQFVHGWADTPEWHQARLEKCHPVGPTEQMKQSITHKAWQPKIGSRWHVFVRQPYLD